MNDVKPSPEGKRVVVLQSNYLPWKGYFDLIRRADLLIFYDDTQYTKNDWRNRNRIKTSRGVEWLTIPCGRHHMHRLIHDVRPVGNEWQRSHWDRIRMSYRFAPYFGMYRDFFESFYRAHDWTNLSELNQYLITTIGRAFLGIQTPILRSTDFHLVGSKEERLVHMLVQSGATRYLSGPTGRQFLRMEPFERAGIRVEWMDYSGYRPYPQLYPPFVHEVSVIDLLFQEGPGAAQYLESTAPLAEASDLSVLIKI